MIHPFIKNERALCHSDKGMHPIKEIIWRKSWEIWPMEFNIFIDSVLNAEEYVLLFLCILKDSLKAHALAMRMRFSYLVLQSSWSFISLEPFRNWKIEVIVHRYASRTVNLMIMQGHLFFSTKIRIRFADGYVIWMEILSKIKHYFPFIYLFFVTVLYFLNNYCLNLWIPKLGLDLCKGN